MRNPHGRFLICPLCLFMPVDAAGGTNRLIRRLSFMIIVCSGFSAKLFRHFADFTQAVIHTGFANRRI